METDTEAQRGIAVTKGTGPNQQSNCHKKHKKSLLAYDVSRALISAANRFPAKYDFAGKETAAPIGALFITESTQRLFGVFCGNWIVGLNELRHREIVRKKINSQGQWHGNRHAGDGGRFMICRGA
ncbi:MAG: hypothetical protein LBM04_11080 [Opitutaceae bacterium]|nr:hypothetical protein [Opitutaceae bacterium]